MGEYSFHGYGGLLLQGAWLSLRLAIASGAYALGLGLLLAILKLRGAGIGARLATGYTTVIRGVPDLLLMLLIYFSAQQALNSATEALGWRQIDIPAFAAACFSIGGVLAAYFAETFRGALLAVPYGQREAGLAIGLSRFQVFRRIWFPQAMIHGIPALSNNIQVLIKATGIVSILGLNDIVNAAHQVGRATNQPLLYLIFAGCVFLVMTGTSQLVLSALQRSLDHGIRSSAT